LSVKRLCLNPAVEPRHLIGLLQQRLWSVETRMPENLIPDSTQKDGKQQTGSNAKGGGGDSHSARSLWPLTDALPGLVSLANKWNGTQYTIDKISYGEWRVKSVSREECRIELVDSQLDLSRVLALRRGAIQRLKKSRGSDFTSTYLGKQLSDFLSHFLEAVLDEMHATYDFQLTTPEYWDLRNALKRRLSEIGAEDDLLLLASEENSARVMSDYLSCISVRWYFDICEFLSSHISKRKQRTGQLSSLSLTSLVAMLPLGPEDRKNVRQSLEEFCSCPPRKSFYSVLNHPFFLLEDGSIAGISALDGGQWTAMVRSKWIQSGDIGSRYGRGWEQYLIWVLDGKHWSVLARNINLKQTKTKCCEIDLLIGRDDVCLLVQVKSFAGLGMNMYDHWKNRQVIERGKNRIWQCLFLLWSVQCLDLNTHISIGFTSLHFN